MMNSEQITRLIEKFEPLKKKMYDGQKYYENENTAIMEREKYFYSITRKTQQIDYTKANNKMPSGFTKIIVDQKIAYLVNHKTDIESNNFEEVVTKNNFKKTLKKVCKNASNKFYGVLQWYIENDQLKSKVIPSEQIILIMSEDDEDKIEYVVRYYMYKGKKTVEVWDDQQVVTYVKDKESKEWTETGRRNHITTKTEAGQVIVSETGNFWGRPPFSIMFNNEEKQNDLNMFKAYVDAYDFVISDFANNFEDYQEMYWILKNYDGQDPAEFMREFKESRVLKVSGEGDASQVAQEVPAMSRETFLKLVRADIFEFAMAVDPTLIRGDSTNLTIKALYQNLDLKTNDFEMEVIEFFEQSLYFINRYREIYNQEPVEAELQLKRSRIMNEIELLTANAGQMGIISEQTRLRNNPWVEDVEKEMEQMGLNVSIDTNPVPMPDDEEDEETFMERCITFVVNEGTDQETAVSMCQRAWSDGQEE